MNGYDSKVASRLRCQWHFTASQHPNSEDEINGFVFRLRFLPAADLGR